MADNDPIEISAGVLVPHEELILRASRSSGPGGQHVNTSSTRIELVWDIASSPSIDDDMRARLMQRLSNRVDSAGKIRLVAQSERSQLRNRDAVIERFGKMIRGALVEQKLRKATKPTKASKRKRIEAKKHRAAVKQQRREPMGD